MRNLKKFFAVVVAVAMMVTAMAPAFAAETAVTTGTTVVADTAAKLADKIGMLKGQGDGVTEQYLATTPTRLQSIIMFLRLKGLEEDALKFTGTESFNDAEDIDWDGGKAIAAYVKANGSTLGIVGTPEGNLEPNAPMTAQAYYKVMLEALGYAQKVDFEWEDTIKFAGEKGLKEVASVASFTVNSLAIATVETLKATTKDGKGTLASQLIKDADLAKEVEAFVFAQAGEATFVELTAKTASSFALKFAGSVDTKNIVATVKRGSIDVTLTPVWSENNTVLTLSTEGKLVTGDYVVSVKNGEKDLGTKNITISEEKLAKIEVTSDTLVRYVVEGDLNTAADDKYYAEASYKAFNQYGDDVTDGALASSINWYCTLPNVAIAASKGLIKISSVIDSDSPFRTDKYYLYKEAVITANETTSAVSASKTLKISETLGNIGEIKLIKVENPDGATMRINAPETFYIEYEVKDVNGNAITSYDVLKNSITFTISNPDIVQTVEFEEDTIDTNKGVISVKFNPASTYTYDSLVTVSAFTKFSGKSASINLDVKKPVAVSKFTLQAPAQEVAANEEVEIPFVAYDQDGVVMTEDVLDNVDISISGPATVEETVNTSGNVDKLYASFPVDGIYTVNANVKNTGNFSQITINVRKTAIPTSLKAIDTSVILPAIANGGVIMADFIDNPAFTVLDQYDRVFDLSKKYQANNITYGIRATASTAGVTVSYVDEDGNSTGNGYINGTDKIKITGNNVPGSLNVKFELVALTTGSVIDERNVSLRVVEDEDITKFEFRDPTALANIYYFNDDDVQKSTSGAVYYVQNDYKVNAEIIGVLSNGIKVAIPNTTAKIPSMSLSNSASFSKAPGDKDNVDVYQVAAYDVDKDKIDVTGTLTAVVVNDGNNYTVTTNLKALTAKPVAKSITLNADYSLVKQQIGDTFILTQDNALALVGEELIEATNAPVWFEIEDQYGMNVLRPVYYSKADITLADIVSGNSFDVTAVTDNGLTKTITIRIQ